MRYRRNPTYMFPSALKAVVRARFPANVEDSEDPVGPFQLRHK